MEITKLLKLLLVMLQARHTHDDPAEQEDCDRALVVSVVDVMLSTGMIVQAEEPEEARAKQREQRAKQAEDRLAVLFARANPNTPKA